jgi:hypothetical protein
LSAARDFSGLGMDGHQTSTRMCHLTTHECHVATQRACNRGSLCNPDGNGFSCCTRSSLAWP